MPDASYDNGSMDARDEQLIKQHVDRKWARGTSYEIVARDVLTSHPHVEPPGPTRGGVYTGNHHSLQPRSLWVARFGADYIEVASAKFAWYGTWWYTILLEFEGGLLRDTHMYSDNCTP